MNTLTEKISNRLISALLFIGIASMFACDKSEDKECPINSFYIKCEESSIDFVFGGYLTGTKYYTIQAAYCPEDGQKLADDMSYSFGKSYKRCYVQP